MATREPQFGHRENGDGTVDSICPHCFATVATVRQEAELDSKEREHQCDRVRLNRLGLDGQDSTSSK